MNKSVVTQELVNAFPTWSKVRSHEQSNGFMLLNCLASPMEHMAKSLVKQQANNFLSSANLDEIDLVHRVALPTTFAFVDAGSDITIATPVAPSVSGLLDGSWYPIHLATNNDIESFWYTSTPTRASLANTISGEHLLVTLAATDLSVSGTWHHHLDGGAVWVETVGGVQYLRVDGETLSRGRVIINGRTRQGQNATETLIFPWDMRQKSTKEWEELYSVEVKDMEDTVEVLVSSANFNADDRLSPWNLRVSENRNKVDEMWGLGSIAELSGYWAEQTIVSNTTLSGASLGTTTFSAINVDGWNQPIGETIYLEVSANLTPYLNSGMRLSMVGLDPNTMLPYTFSGIVGTFISSGTGYIFGGDRFNFDLTTPMQGSDDWVPLTTWAFVENVEMPPRQHSTLDRMGYVSDEWQQLVMGFVDKEAKARWELLDENGTPVSGVDMAIQPFSDNAWVVTSDGQLYCYTIIEDMVSGVTALRDRTTGSEVQVDVENLHVLLGDNITFTPWHALPIREVNRYRVTVITPSGLTYGAANRELTAQPTWYLGSSLSRVITDSITFRAEERGEYVLSIEAEFLDGTTHIDRVLVAVESKRPLTHIDISSLVPGIVTGIDFDADQKLWVQSGSNYYQINLHTDIMLIDYDRKIMYFKEPYEEVGIEV